MMASQIKIIILLFTSILMLSQKQADRTILIFADKAGNPNVIQQVNLLKADPVGTKSRNIIYTVIPYNQSNLVLYKKWHVPNASFTVLLIGKDNGEKLRTHDPVTLARLYDLIDNMPMRRIVVKYKQ